MTDHKVVVVGTYGAGKTALVRRLLDDKFDEYTQMTIGAEYRVLRLLTRQVGLHPTPAL